MGHLWSLLVLICIISIACCQRCGKDRIQGPKFIAPEVKNSTECLEYIRNKQKSSGLKAITLQNITFTQGFPGRAFQQFEFEAYDFQRFCMRSFNASSDSPFLGIGSQEKKTKIKRITFLEPRCSVSSWTWIHLAQLQLEQMEFSTFSDGYFSPRNILPESIKTLGGPSAKVLKIVTSCLKELAPNSLSTFVNLEFLSLAGNVLETIPWGVLPDRAPRLKTIDLSRNRLHCLDPRNYWKPINYPQLREIRLQHNNIKTVFEYFRRGTRVEHIYLNGVSELQCNMRLAWMLNLKAAFWEKSNEAPAYCNSLPRVPLREQQYDDLQYKEDEVECVNQDYADDEI